MLKVSNVSVSYQEGKPVLRDFTLDVQTGEVIGVLGMNGAGKTSFFNTLYGLLEADSGSVEFNEKPLERSSIAYLETESYFYPYMRGDEYIELVKRGKYNEELNQVFELPLDRYISNYSTGMKKKLAFWAVFEQEKPLVILDEPFNGVDLESVEVFYQFIEEMKKLGNTILISSHILETLTRVCDRIAYLDNGQVQHFYTSESFGQLQADIQQRIKEKTKKIIG